MVLNENIATSPSLWQQLLEPVGQLLRQAGRLILDSSQTRLQVEKKSADNYVTDIDLAVQKYMLARLAEWTPAWPVIAEESATGRQELTGQTWILDPVHGTTNLMRAYHHSAISLALADENRLLLGFVYNPYTDELFTAVAGGGAHLNGLPIQTSRHSKLRDCLVGFGTTPYDRANAHLTFSLAENIFMQTLEIRRSGSAALDLAYVACGRLDAFFELCLQPWDYAAGSLILQEAGGQVTNWQGNAPSLQQGDSILATNKLVHQALLDLVGNTAGAAVVRVQPQEL